MTSSMNRRARRANKNNKPEAEIAVFVVAMELVEFYYRTQIASEGIWNADPPVIVVRPAEEFSRADDAWFQRTLAEMWQVREPGTWRIYYEDSDVDLDVGLIDVLISFPTEAGRPKRNVTSDDYFRVLDQVTGGELHTQMVIASAVHRHRPDGSAYDHYHNLIFGLRKEIDGEQVHLGQPQPVLQPPLLMAIGEAGYFRCRDKTAIRSALLKEQPLPSRTGGNVRQRQLRL